MALTLDLGGVDGAPVWCPRQRVTIASLILLAVLSTADAASAIAARGSLELTHHIHDAPATPLSSAPYNHSIP